MEEITTPTVKLLGDGTIECAKGLEMKDCGYKPGAKVCGKCGAKAVTQTEEAVPADAAPEVASEKSAWVTADNEKGVRKNMHASPMAEEEEDEMPMNPAKEKRMMAFLDQEKMYDDEEKGMHGDEALKKKKKRMMAFLEEEKMYGAEEDDMPEDTDEDEEKMYGEIEKIMERRKKARGKRMESMGVKSADYDSNAFMCAIERTMYGGGSQICAQCPGGCNQVANLPSILEIEGMAESMFAAKVLDSGYADLSDIFVVDLQRKDGKPMEAYFDGSSGECMGWHLLDDNLIGEIASVSGQKVISFSEASDIAVKSIEGEVVSVDADMFEGYDAYAVEIEGVDGKSYDVFVGVDGEILGYDEYDADEASDIDAEISDLALKRAYSDEDRDSMAKEGVAMPDGSFPIKDETDLENAIRAHGRAEDITKAKAHIKKRAMALGAEDMIPEDWANDEKALSDEETKNFLGNLMEFELLAIDAGIDLDNPK